MSYRDWKFCVEEKAGQRVDDVWAFQLYVDGYSVMAAVVVLINT
jgi:hypothetical protein